MFLFQVRQREICHAAEHSVSVQGKGDNLTDNLK